MNSINLQEDGICGVGTLEMADAGRGAGEMLCVILKAYFRYLDRNI